MKRGLGIVLWAAGCVVQADESPRAALEQRVQLASRLLADGAAHARIAGSGNRQAQSHLDQGRLHHSMAEEALKRGELAAARREIDEALQHLGRARRLAPDAPARQAIARQRFDQQLASFERLIEAWRARMAPGGAGGDELTAAVAGVGHARTLAADGRYDDALRTLEQAQQPLLAGLNRLLHAQTIDYTARGETPAQIYALELARHRALAELIPLALREMSPRPEAVSLIERYRQMGDSLRAQAQQRLDAGDPNQALASLQSATLYLQRALSAAGVNTPPEEPR